MRIRTEFEAACAPEAAWDALHDPGVATKLYAPALGMEPEGEFPSRFATGSVVLVHLRALGVVPMGAQEIRITDLYQGPAGEWPRTMRDHGRPCSGPLARLTDWRHEITISPSPSSPLRAVWADELYVEGAITPLLTPMLALMWRWRGRRLRRLSRNW